MEMLEKTASNEMWNLMWQTFENASLTYDLVSVQNVTKTHHEDNYPLDNPAKLGIITGLIIACVADFRISKPKFQLDACLETKLRWISETMINLISFLLLAPLVSVILTILFVYRKIVEFVLKFQLGDNFAGLLEGTDCVWALEQSTGLSVINVLALLEKNNATNDETFLSNLRNLINDRLSSSNFDKLNWLRHKKYGYFYWRKNVEVSMDERVRWLDEDVDHLSCDETCGDINGDFLRTMLTKATNKTLPREHSTSWEILVCRSCDVSSSKSFWETKDNLDVDGDERRTMIPLLFRVHHCLGDGVALLRLLLESIADSESQIIEENNPKTSTRSHDENHKIIRLPLLRKNSSILGTLRQDNEYLEYANDLISASMPFTPRICEKTVDDVKKLMAKLFFHSSRIFEWNCLERLLRNFRKIVELLNVVISIPSCLVQQALRSMDNSALHGPGLTGEKILSCWMESNDDDSQHLNLMTKIRDIKNSTGTRFGDVVLAALSENLHRYFSKIGEAAPKAMTVVIPARMIAPSEKLSLQNGFSVGLLKLGISEINGETIKNDSPKVHELWKRLNDVSKSSDKLRDDPDYLINFWVMKWLSAALPECLLKPVLESRSTLAFSNLPGPGEVSVLGYQLKNVAFWIPHRGTTGICCSLLTYGGKVHFALIADTAIMRSSKLLDEILRGTLENIEKMYDGLLLSRFSQ